VAFANFLKRKKFQIYRFVFYIEKSFQLMYNFISKNENKIGDRCFFAFHYGLKKS